MSYKLGVFINHPCHNLPIGIHIWCWHIIKRSKIFVELLYPSARKSFEFSFRKGLGIDDDTSLPSSKWEIEGCRLDTHPSRESHNFILVHILMIPNTTLVWTTSCIVLTAVASEDTSCSIVHENWYRDFDDPLWKEYLLELAIITSLEKCICSAHLGLRGKEWIVGRHNNLI